MSSPAISPEAKQAITDMFGRHDARVTRIREVIIAQHWFQTRHQWKVILQMVTRTIRDLVVPRLMLRAQCQPISEFADDARELSALTYAMYLDLWHSVTADLKPEWDYRHRAWSHIDPIPPAERDAMNAGLELAREVAILVEQMIHRAPPSAPADWTKADWKRHFDDFRMLVFSEAGVTITLEADVDSVAGYRSTTNRKNLGTKKQTPDAVAAYAGVLKLSPDAFLRKNKTLLNRLTLIDRD